MKPAVVAMLLTPHLPKDQVLKVHVTKRNNETNPLYLIGFDAGLAHCYHITGTSDGIVLVEAYEDIDNWTAFGIDKAITLDELNIVVSKMNKEQQNTPSFLDMMEARVHEIRGGQKQ